MTMLAGTGKNGSHGSSGPDSSNFSAQTFTSQHHPRQTPPNNVDRDNYSGNSSHRARRRILAVVHGSKIRHNAKAIFHTPIPSDIPSKVYVNRRQYSSLKPSKGAIDQTLGVGASASKIKGQVIIFLSHVAYNFIDIVLMSIMVDILNIAPYSVRKLAQSVP
jgi:hypothetical protein